MMKDVITVMIVLGVGLGTMALTLGGYLYIKKQKQKFKRYTLRYEKIQDRFK